MARKNGVDDLRHDRIVVADNAREHRSVAIRAQAARQVLAQFVLDAASAQTLFGKDTAAQVTQRARKTTHERNPPGNYNCLIIPRHGSGSWRGQSLEAENYRKSFHPAEWLGCAHHCPGVAHRFASLASSLSGREVALLAGRWKNRGCGLRRGPRAELCLVSAFDLHGHKTL